MSCDRSGSSYSNEADHDVVSMSTHDSEMNESNSSSGSDNGYTSDGEFTRNLADRKAAARDDETPMKATGARNWMKQRSNIVEDDFKKRKTANKSSLREHLRAAAVEACRENDDLKAENQQLSKETEDLKFENMKLKNENDTLRDQLLHFGRGNSMDCDVESSQPWKEQGQYNVVPGENTIVSQSQVESRQLLAAAAAQLLELESQMGSESNGQRRSLSTSDQECKSAQNGETAEEVLLALLANLQQSELARTEDGNHDTPMEQLETVDLLRELLTPLLQKYLESTAQQQLPARNQSDKLFSRQTTGATSDTTSSTPASETSDSSVSSQQSPDSDESASLQLSMLQSMQQQQRLSPDQLAQLIQILNLS